MTVSGNIEAQTSMAFRGTFPSAFEYPESWTGEFSAETSSSKITVNGRNVRVTRSSPGVPKTMGGFKGEGPSSIRMASYSGGPALHVGESEGYLGASIA
ncbi:hypothetical protein E4U57_002425 [Claviceps arundinis]|uniref:Uncharacterized protein n=1 Tax=Claviceps arundinis TaxID=1623583 RepID=A0ABQ7PP06_9HYPO|nr:hypothetical protein E4U57_002425 [Claviceps arundinis]